jgi:uncharacterized protein
MGDRQYHLHDGRKGSALGVRVTPRASHNEITGFQEDGTVKIRLTAPPVESEANAALVEFLAEVLGVPKSRLDIVAGLKGHDKLVAIMDMEKEEVQSRLTAYIG